MEFLFGTLLRRLFRKRLLTTVGIFCLSLLFDLPAVKASVILSFATSVPDPMVAGSGGYVDVFVASSGGSSHSLDGFQVRVAITPGGGSSGPIGGLIFSAVQGEAQLGIGGATGYVFFGNSLVQNLPPQTIGDVSGGGSLYTGYDATFDFMPMTLTTTAQLLYRLDLSAVTQGTYVIDAVPDVSSFFSDQSDPIGSAIDFTSTASPLTVSAATAVPEPSSSALLIVGFGVITLRRRLRRYISVSIRRSSLAEIRNTDQ